MPQGVVKAVKQVLWLLLPIGVCLTPISEAIAQSSSSSTACQPPALSRLTRHRVRSGETLNSIAAQYRLIPATLIGLNPQLRQGRAPVGSEILVPPYNGIRVEVPTGSNWREIAKKYNVRADVLFEVNGCQDSPRVVFVPGVNWSPTPTPTTANSPIDRYPLDAVAPVVTRYGWQLNPASGQVVFHSGVNLSATSGTPVLAVGAGTIAFVGNQTGEGKLIVINHAQGLQTRYSQLGAVAVRSGQQVRAGQQIGTVGAQSSGAQSSSSQAGSTYLHFEVRSNSNLGWVAQDPGQFLPQIRANDRR